jgi:arylsulfatase A-like enzyme
LDTLENIYLEDSPLSAQTALLFTSPRGFPAGEHRRVGACDDALYGEVLNAPWIMRLPDREGAMHRSRTLVQPPDLFATVLDWCGSLSDEACCGRTALPIVRDEQPPVRDRACAIAGDQRAIRTPAWHLREDPAAPRRHELFAKPDDRWEVNEVSDRCPDIVAQLIEALDQFHQAAQSGRLAALPPLPEVLLEGLD